MLRGLRFPTVLLLAIAMMPHAQANEIEFTYNTEHQDSKVYGFGKKETYDVAIKIDDPTYVGMRVKSLSVDLPAQPEWIEGCTGWISRELKLENKQNVADLASCSGVLSDEVLTVNFESSVTIPADGLYVGYSFKVVELGQYSTKPICLIEGQAPNGLWVHTSRSRLKWCNLGQELEAVSTMTVTLEGDFAEYDVAPILPAECYAAIDRNNTIQCSFINRGTQPVSDITYNYTIGNVTGSGSCHFDKALPCGRDNQVSVGIEMSCPRELAEYPMEFTISTVNGNPNGSDAAKCASTMVVMPLIPVNRPLVEEFTGLNCAYCPRGYVAMEQMSHDYEGTFIGLAYHSSYYESPSAMCCLDPSDFPMDVNSFPNGCVNRDKLVDPSYFPEIWEGYREAMPVAEVSAELTESTEDSDILKATARINFVRDLNGADYRISIAIAADGLKNAAWKQANAFAGEEDSELTGPIWDIFTKGESRVSGLTFNDVVVYYKDLYGVENSVPDMIKAGDVISYSIEVKKTDIVNLKGEPFVNQDAMLKAVAVLHDGNGKPVNCNRSVSVPYSGSGMEMQISDCVPVETVFYDLAGNIVKYSTHGVYIRLDRMNDNSTKTAKIVL